MARPVSRSRKAGAWGYAETIVPFAAVIIGGSSHRGVIVAGT